MEWRVLEEEAYERTKKEPNRREQELLSWKD